MLQDAAPIQMSLYRVRLLLEEGRTAAALSELEGLQPTNEQQKLDIAYLLGWCYIQSKQWSEAVHELNEVVGNLSPSLKEAQLTPLTELDSPLERERLVLCLLHLGIAAVNLSHYEDASQHFTLCLKILHDRRVHLPLVRIKARYSLAMTCLMRGLYSAAIQHYEEALRLCRHYSNEEEVPHIYHGLCIAYRYTADFPKACVAAEDALRLYEQRHNHPMEARMHNVLGHIQYLLGDFQKANEQYTESLAIANSYNGPNLIMVNCADLAELRLADGRIEEARRYCQWALETMERSNDVHMRGLTLLTVGKVIRKEALQADTEQRRPLLEEALKYFQRACEQLEQTQAYPDRAEAYGHLAQTLEDLDRVGEAIDCWRSGYASLAHKTPSYTL
jgi:tetratricopeptide (TPR) repeat protein